MSRSIIEIEAQRGRWTRYRQRQQLHPDAGQDFARGGLGRQVDNLDLRLLFLPSDPSAEIAPIDHETVEWLKKDRELPFHGHPPSWSSDRTVADAIVRFDYYRDETDWVRYLALHRHGGIEIGASGHSYEIRDTRILSLRHIVGLAWIAADLQADAVERWKIAAPFELTVGMTTAQGTALGGFAEGWLEIGQVYTASGHAWTTTSYSVGNSTMAENIAMDVGNRLEQAFGTTHRRHLANRGEYEGRFDPRFGY